MSKDKFQFSILTALAYTALAALLVSMIPWKRNVGSGRRIYAIGFPLFYYRGLLEDPPQSDISMTIISLDYLIALVVLAGVAWIHLLIRIQKSR